MIIVGFALIAMFFLGTYFGLLLERRNNQKENTSTELETKHGK